MKAPAGQGSATISALGVILIMRIDRCIQRSDVGKDRAGHVADEDRYWSHETVASSLPRPQLAGRMRSFDMLGR